MLHSFGIVSIAFSVLFLFLTLERVSLLRVYDPPNLQIVSPIVSESISNDEREVDVRAGIPLHIRCIGSQPIFWFYPNLLQVNGFEIKSSGQCNETISCESNFLIEKTYYNQTGLFTCHYNDSTTFENSDSVYIYFNDPKKLIVPVTTNAAIDVIAKRLSSVRIPCIPTNSKTNVTLWKVDSTVTGTKQIELKPKQVEPGSIEGFSYDPKIGFHIQRGFLDLSSGVFSCKFSLFNETQDIQVIIYFSTHPETVLAPVIDNSLAKKVIVFGRFALICKVDVVGLGNITIDWLYPKANDSVIKLSKTKSKIINFGKHSISSFSRKIIVSKTRPGNAGCYTCQVTDSKNKLYQKSKYITVYDYTKKPFIELSTDLPTNSIKMNTGEQLKLTVYMNVFPKVEFEGIYWLKDGKVIDALNTPGYTSNYGDNEASLEIANVTAKDIGFYSLKVSSENVESDIIIHVLIEGKPFISLSADNQTAKEGSKHKIACHAIGYPPPSKVEIFFNNCTLKCDKSEEKLIKIGIKDSSSLFINQESVNIEKQVNKVILTMDYTARQSGIYTCFAENKFGYIYKHHTLMVVPSALSGSTSQDQQKSDQNSAKESLTINLIFTLITTLIPFLQLNYCSFVVTTL